MNIPQSSCERKSCGRGGAATGKIAAWLRSAARCVVALAAGIALWSGAASAQESWTITATPYLWLQGMTGDIKVHGVKAHVDDNFFDVLGKTDTVLGAFLHVDARQGPWGLYGEVDYAYTSAKDKKGPFDTRIRTGTTILELGGMYRLLEGSVGQAGAPERWRIEAAAGVRYLSFNAKVDFGPLSADKTQSWVDPVIGLNATVDLSEHWSLIGHADIAGFGVGSDFSTNLYGLVGYRTTMFGADVLSTFGYRGLYINRSDGSRDSSVDLWMHGPALGLTFRF